MNIVKTIRRNAIGRSDHPAVIESDRRVTYGQLLSRVDALQRRFTDRGIAAGHRVAFCCPDGADYIAGTLALLQLGAVIVPITLKADDVDRAATIERIDVHGVMSLADQRTTNAADTADMIFADEDGPGWHWRPRRARGDEDANCRRVNAAFIRFSSGTTGASKGVVLSHQTIHERTEAANRGLRISGADRVLWVLGMQHHFVVSILLFLRQGATMVMAGNDFPFGLIEAVRRERVTFIYASPVHYDVLARAGSVDAAALVDVRLAISTAMKTSRATSEAFEARFGFHPAQAYGIIEVGLPLINTEASEAPGSVGRLLGDYELRIEEADAEGIGDLMIRGKGMLDAYFSPWCERQACLRDGWFATGDLGRLDESGRLYLMGRSKSVIVTAGMKIFPEEVEQVVNGTPGVLESRVSGRRHDGYGQVPTAEVVLSETGKSDAAAVVEEARRRCFAQLASYKAPVEFDVVEALTKTASGKIVRRPTMERSDE